MAHKTRKSGGAVPAIAFDPLVVALGYKNSAGRPNKRVHSDRKDDLQGFSFAEMIFELNNPVCLAFVVGFYRPVIMS